jgi:chemotaxis protein MotB
MLRRKRRESERIGRDRWLVSYADFITLLFAFFTTMYAISTVDAQKMGKMVMSMRASFDSTVFQAGSKKLALGNGAGDSAESSPDLVRNIIALEGGSVRSGVNLAEIRGNFLVSSGPGPNLGTLKRSIESLVGPELLNRRVHTRLDRRGLTVSLGEGGVFDSGSDRIKPEGRALLDSIAGGLASIDNQIRVEGHTDNVPIRNSRFPSNWELSTARATAVLAYLVARFKLEPGNLSAAGYAEYRPVDSNDTESGRARNRRVDLVVLDPRNTAAEP